MIEIIDITDGIGDYEFDRMMQSAVDMLRYAMLLPEAEKAVSKSIIMNCFALLAVLWDFRFAIEDQDRSELFEKIANLSNSLMDHVDERRRSERLN